MTNDDLTCDVCGGTGIVADGPTRTCRICGAMLDADGAQGAFLMHSGLSSGVCTHPRHIPTYRRRVNVGAVASIDRDAAHARHLLDFL